MSLLNYYHTFLSVSPLSFISSLSPSLIEDLLCKKSGDIQLYGNCIKSRILCQKLKIWYEKRWFCLKDTFIVYLNSFLNYSISFVMLVDCAFECKMTIKANAYHAIEIKNLERRLTLKCKSSHQQNDWFQKIMLMVRNSGKDFNDKTLLRYGSFAPNRASQLCRWYVNSSTYMEHIMHALNGAQEEIYIADWWLCPELYLKRPTDDFEYRLDKILLNKAKAGVKVYILLYKEITLVIDLMSLRTRQILTEHGSNPNIKVLRHPDHFFDGVFMWSHHEKFVVIDQTVGFIGGIDLCYGRWDDEYHRLVDLGTKKNITQIVNKKEPNANKITVHSQSEINVIFLKIILGGRDL
ncbi:phospholipase D1 [Brachionus plicatilis]|uniref:phospholipase D n=1 Tax=Brachionus plicatilis TaxID=10195 RepID=A0A3M7SXU8_BRAPC|nr:phospholipase D1 [Brachionus plicatilis]